MLGTVSRWRPASVYLPGPAWLLGPGCLAFRLIAHFCSVVVGLCFVFNVLLCFGRPNAGGHRGFSLVPLDLSPLESPFPASFKAS